MMPSTTREIFRYSDLEGFLESHIADRRGRDANWSIHGWAKALGLSNAASITRVLSGERTVSGRMCDALQEYFRFSALEREYFLFLSLKNKSKTDPLLKATVQRACWPVPPLMKSQSRDQPLLEMSNGKVLSLVGEASLEKLNSLLSEGNLECVASQGTAIVYLSACDYSRSSLGPYREFYVGICCRPKGASLSEFGMSFRKIHCSSATVVSLGSMVWGNEYTLGEVSVCHDSASVSQSGSLNLEMISGSPPESVKRLPSSADLLGFAASHGSLRRFRLQLKYVGTEYVFNPQTDSLRLSPDGEVADFIRFLGFTPKLWQFRERLSCQVSQSSCETPA